MYTRSTVRTVQEKLNSAFIRSGKSVRELLEQSALDIDRSNMSRKIRGKTPMLIGEAEAVAKALGMRVAVVRRKAA